MTPKFQDLSILSGGLIALLIALAVWLKNSKKWQLANLFLFAFLLNCFVSIILKFLYFNNLFTSSPHFLKLNHPLGLLRPVCFYLYFYYIFRPKISLKKLHFIHFIPTLFILLYTTPFYILSSFQKIEIINNSQLDNAPTGIFFAAFTVLLAFFYLFLSVYEWSKFHKQNSSLSTLIRWLSTMLVGYGLYMISAGLPWIMPNKSFEYLSYQIISIFIIFGCVKLLSSSSLPEIQEAPVKYAKSKLKAQEKEILIELSNQLMINEKLFLSEDLRLKNLADKLEITENQLSQIINEYEKMSFNDFVNKFRIIEAKKLLVSEKLNHVTIEAIGYEVGFGTRASFYNAFKKYTETTPTKFRQEAIEKSK